MSSRRTRNRQEVLVETSRPFKLVHQLVMLNDVDLPNKTIRGSTELSMLPLRPDLTDFKLNAAASVQIMAVSINGFDCLYSSFDAIAVGLSKMQDANATRDYLTYSNAFLTSAKKIDPEIEGGGELKIIVPDQCRNSIQDMKLFKVCIDFVVCNPLCGLQFVLPSKKNSEQNNQPSQSGEMENVGYIPDDAEKGAHMFTFKSSAGGMSTRYWLPCVDTVSELCMWTMEVTVNANHVAVCSGMLHDTVYSHDAIKKTYHYLLTTPTGASNIGVAIGELEISVHPEMHELTSFCPMDLLTLLQYTTKDADKLMEFFEELVSVRYPYPSYNQVFVDQCPEDIISYAGMSIINVNLLYHARQIDCVPLTRTILANGLAQQFFGCYTAPQTWLESWLTRGLARYMTGLFLRCFFGNNEYLFHLHRSSIAVCEYESFNGPVVLRPKVIGSKPEYCSATSSQQYSDVLAKKAHLILRMLEKRLGKELFFQVLNKILALSTHSAQQKNQPALWQHMLVSTDGFFKIISNVTGQELPTFLEMWVQQGGHAHFDVNVSFNRKKNMVELEIKQTPSANKGRLKYVGPLTIVLQELDGSFAHTVQIDDVISKHDINCHSKARRQRKKKIPLWTGEELDMDLSLTDPDSPMLWMRVDPELLLIRCVELHQPDYHWIYQLSYERDVLAQLNSLSSLVRFPSLHAKQALMQLIENNQCYFRVRCQAALVLAEMCNKLQTTSIGPPALLTLFKKMFGSTCDSNIPKPNNFSNFQAYFVMQAIPSAMAMLRSGHGLGFPEVHNFLLQLLKFNDNSMNKYGDDNFRQSVLVALAQTTAHVCKTKQVAFTPSLTTGIIDLDHEQQKAENLLSDIKASISELCLHLNMDRVRPSYNRVVTIACLRGVYMIMKRGHIPLNTQLWCKFAQPGQFQKVRQTAIDCLVNFAASEKSPEIFLQLLKMGIHDADPCIRYHVLKVLSTNPVFSAVRHPKSHVHHPLNKIELIDYLWEYMTTSAPMDSRVRIGLLDVFVGMWGKATPSPFLPREEYLDEVHSSGPSSLNTPNQTPMARVDHIPFNERVTECLIRLPPMPSTSDHGPTLQLPVCPPPSQITSTLPTINNQIRIVPEIGGGTAITVDLPPPIKMSRSDDQSNVSQVAFLSDDEMN